MQIHGQTDRHPPLGGTSDLADVRRGQKNSYAGALIALLAAFSVFVLDAWTKDRFFPIAKDSTWSLFHGFVRLIEFRNYGISFNIPLPFFLTAIIAIMALAWALREIIGLKAHSSQLKAVFLGFFIGGVIGNLFDRVTLGFVRDWLLLWGMSAVNLADGAILFGLIGYLWTVKPLTKPQK